MKKLFAIISLIFLLAACTIQPAPSNNIETQADPWTFLGLPLSTNTYLRDTALRGNDRPMVVRYILDSATSTYTLRFQEWNGTAWTTFASRINSPGYSALAVRSKANSTDMTIDPVGIANYEGNNQIKVRVWSGSSWTSFPATPPRVDKYFSSIALALDKSGLPTVAWFEYGLGDAGFTDKELHVMRWNGSQWQALGDVVRSYSYFYLSRFESIDLEIDPYNRPVVATEGYVGRWNATSWVKLGQYEIVSFPDVTFDNNNRLTVVSARGKGGSAGKLGRIRVHRWNNTGWLQLGGNLDVYDTDALASTSRAFISVDASNRPVVTWGEQVTFKPELENVYVKRWNGSSWVLIGSKLDKVITNLATPFGILTTRAGKVIVGWTEAGSIYIKQR